MDYCSFLTDLKVLQRAVKYFELFQSFVLGSFLMQFLLFRVWHKFVCMVFASSSDAYVLLDAFVEHPPLDYQAAILFILCFRLTDGQLPSNHAMRESRKKFNL